MSDSEIRFEVRIKVSFTEKITSDGGSWFYAKSSMGDECNSNSKADCIRIITETARRRAGLDR